MRSLIYFLVLTLLLGPYLLFFQSKLSANDVSSLDSKPFPQIGKWNQFPVKDDFFVAKLWISELFSILQSSFPRGRQVDQNRRFLLVAFSLSHNIQNIQNPPLLNFFNWLWFGAISFFSLVCLIWVEVLRNIGQHWETSGNIAATRTKGKVLTWLYWCVHQVPDLKHFPQIQIYNKQKQMQLIPNQNRNPPD